MCLDHSAHGVEPNHEIFRAPYEVDLEWETAPTPTNYFQFWNGRNLGPRMRTWRVQKTGYVDDPSMQPGVVAGYWGYTDSPDSEMIASGLNTKGPRYPSIGRHGNFFQWGFAADPTQMTESGRQAFVNSICYIARFDGQAPLARAGTSARGYALDRAFRVAHIDESYADLVETYRGLGERYDEALAAREAGDRELTAVETSILGRPRPEPMSRDEYIDLVLRGIPKELLEELGKDEQSLPKYLAAVEENLEYLVQGEGGLEIDTDARALGISNRNPALLDRALALVESGEDAERGLRLLRRYTDQDFDDASGWSAWLDAHRGRLFFSDTGGFRWFPTRASRPDELPPAEEPDGSNPVVWDAHVLRGAGGAATLAVRAQVLDGWHIYASTPAGSPYRATSVVASLPDGAEFDGEWDLPVGVPSPEDPTLEVLEGQAVFRRTVAAESEGTIEVVVSWQACDAHRCLPPTTTTIEVEIGGS